MTATATYIVADNRSKPVQIEAASMREAAEAFVADCYFSDFSKTFWVDIYVYESLDALDDDEYSAKIAVGIDPPEPPCRSGHEHEWVDGPVRLSCVGLTHEYECECCGLKRIEDSFATRPDTGENGFFSVEYEV